MSDLIDRQAAIETVKKHYRVDNDLLEVIAYEIEALPSAQLAQDLPNGCTDTISRAAALSALNGLTKIFLNNLPPTIDRADAVDAIKALPHAIDTNVGDNLIDRQAALEALENINHVFMDLGMSCAYDMPSFWCYDRKEYKVIPTKYHKGYQKALEDVEEKIKPILEELCYG